MTFEHHPDPNEWSHEAWDANAAFWDARMGEGNDFVKYLVWPAVLRLFAVQPGEQILDVACGNGLTSRRLAGLGARVLAVDFSQELLNFARGRTAPDLPVEYRLVDATDETALLSLGSGYFDGMLCNMALFDMAEVDPLMRAAARLLRPGGRFVFSTLHPCFNSSSVVKVAEEEDVAEGILTHYAVKVYTYMTAHTHAGHAMRGQPIPQPYFHRSLQDLLGAGLAAGLVIDGLEERAFAPDDPVASNLLSWGPNFSEFPPVMVVRMRRMV